MVSNLARKRDNRGRVRVKNWHLWSNKRWWWPYLVEVEVGLASKENLSTHLERKLWDKFSIASRSQSVQNKCHNTEEPRPVIGCQHKLEEFLFLGDFFTSLSLFIAPSWCLLSKILRRWLTLAGVKMVNNKSQGGSQETSGRSFAQFFSLWASGGSDKSLRACRHYGSKLFVHVSKNSFALKDQKMAQK